VFVTLFQGVHLVRTEWRRMDAEKSNVKISDWVACYDCRIPHSYNDILCRILVVTCSPIIFEPQRIFDLFQRSRPNKIRFTFVFSYSSSVIWTLGIAADYSLSLISETDCLIVLSDGS